MLGEDSGDLSVEEVEVFVDSFIPWYKLDFGEFVCYFTAQRRVLKQSRIEFGPLKYALMLGLLNFVFDAGHYHIVVPLFVYAECEWFVLVFNRTDSTALYADVFTDVSGGYCASYEGA